MKGKPTAAEIRRRRSEKSTNEATMHRESGGPLDPRLTDFDWEGRRAAPVEKLIDLHVHYRGDPKTLDILFPLLDRYRVECIHLIFDRGAGKDDLRRAGTYGKIGERIIPFFRLDLRTGDSDQVRRARDLGFWGLKFIHPRYPYDDRVYDPILSLAQDYGMPCLFHTGVLGRSEHKIEAGCGMSLMRADMLDTLANRYPDLLIQGAHLGNPDVAAAFRASQCSPNLIWDASGGIRHLLQGDPRLLYACMYGLPDAWTCFAWSTDTTTAVFPPEYADGWPNQIEYQICYWQRIFAQLPVKPGTADLDRFFYGNARAWIDRIVAKRAG
ncbi:MAG: amidohydrolase family protein [Planctomycetota bacterium]|nr:amidohydrolase family protein [Planctomycetota bacterium]